MHGDDQLCGVGQPVGVGDPVGEELGQGLACRERLDGGVGTVDVVEVRAVGADAQGAEQAGHHRTVG
ncbi:hypothetical protein D3C80_1714370 [compost metagenome]